jgi:phosphoribosylformylglycinamidine synthase
MNTKNSFCNKYSTEQVLKLNIAHNEGNYFTNSDHLKELENEELVAFKYCNKDGNIANDNNPNGSMNNIAGIFNKNKNILGMMPHPERMTDEILSGKDGVNLFISLLN